MKPVIQGFTMDNDPKHIYIYVLHYFVCCFYAECERGANQEATGYVFIARDNILTRCCTVWKYIPNCFKWL